MPVYDAPTALVIDDSPIVRCELTCELRRQGLAVTFVRDGLVGLECAVVARPTIIFLDLKMPVTLGLEVCRRLRATPETRDIPVVIVSARPNPHERAAAIDAGADAFVYKPFCNHEIEMTVRALLVGRPFGSPGAGPRA